MKNNQNTLIHVSLEQLRPFDLNPRITRNPLYEEIKESIRNRGLEHIPHITQRPGESFYIIANGGNTRLAILNELWLETHDKKYWDICCLFREWEAGSIDEGNLNCLLGHLIESDKHGSLTFIERALGVHAAIDIYQKINRGCSQNEMVLMLAREGYAVSQSLLSIMLSAISLLLPFIPDLLYSGLSRTSIEKLLALRSNTEKFWDKYCDEHFPTEHQRPLFNDIFGMALTSFNGPAAGYSLEHIQDELTGLVSQTLNIDYNTVALITDARAQKRSIILGVEPVPELPDVSQQRSVDLKYRDKKQQENNPPEKNEAIEGDDGAFSDNADRGMTGGVGEPENKQSPSAVIHNVQSADLSGKSHPEFAEENIYRDPQFDTPEILASLIDQTAWELAENAGLEFLISPTESGVFDIASPDEELTNEARICWQLLSFLAGKLPGSAIIWRQMLTGTPATPAGFDDDTLKKIFSLICYIRRLYEKQRRGDNL